MFENDKGSKNILNILYIILITNSLRLRGERANAAHLGIRRHNFNAYEFSLLKCLHSETLVIILELNLV
jgi:hypothetical protein